MKKSKDDKKSAKRDEVETSEEEEAAAATKNTDRNSLAQTCSPWRCWKVHTIFILIAILIAVYTSNIPKSYIQEILKFSHLKESICTPVSSNQESNSIKKPTYWIYGAGGEGQWLHVKNVLRRLGFERVTENESSTADLLWAHDYPFTKIRSKVINLEPHQKVNHFPGCGFITNKIDLATTKLKHIPSAFKLPKDKDEFKAFAEKNPDKRFVVKHHQHRHIKIMKMNEINMEDNNTFIQEFIENPLLVDGYKFDIGVYTIITSINPLRVYAYYGDILFRYCAQKYHPFDPENVDKYIVGDDYLPTWQIPSLEAFYNELGFGMKTSFDAYLKMKGKDPEIIWTQVLDAIREAILSKESSISALLDRYKNKQSFFEMARFDLIVDDNLKVYLMEANMSPNLSSAHFKQNFILYEQVIYNVLNLVGVGNYVQRESFEKLDRETELMLSTYKNIMVNGEKCGKLPCLETCASIECQFCNPCMEKSEINDLTLAYREHVNKGDTKRIFPVTGDALKNIDSDPAFKQLSARNQWMTKWFQAKCAMDSSWC